MLLFSQAYEGKASSWNSTATASAAAARVQHGSSRLHRRARTDAADHHNDRLIIN